MSDDEYFSDNNISDSESFSEPKPIKKTSNTSRNINKPITTAHADPDDNENSDPDEDSVKDVVSDGDDDDNDDDSVIADSDNENNDDDDDSFQGDNIENDEVNLNNNKNTSQSHKYSSNLDSLKANEGYNENFNTLQSDDDDDDDDCEYLDLLENNINSNYLEENHPECLSHNYDEVQSHLNIVKDKYGNIIDPLHKTSPILSKYEKTRIIGQRAKQIADGSKPFINLSHTIIEPYIIAEMELQQKKIPFIIKRPIPNGGFEYWRLRDLEIISF